MKTRIIATISLLLALMFMGCAIDPNFQGFGLKPSELNAALNTDLENNSIKFSEFVSDAKLRDDGGYSRIFTSTSDDITLYMYTKDGLDGIRVVASDFDLGGFMQVSEAVIRLLEGDSANGIITKLLLGKAESSKYSFSSGTSIPEDENGLSNLSNVKWVLNIIQKQSK